MRVLYVIGWVWLLGAAVSGDLRPIVVGVLIGAALALYRNRLLWARRPARLPEARSDPDGPGGDGELTAAGVVHDLDIYRNRRRRRRTA